MDDIECLTEHQYIYFEIQNGTTRSAPAEKNQSFCKLGMVEWGAADSGDESDNCETIIKKAYEASIKRKNTRAKKMPYWWTLEIKEKRRDCISLRRREQGQEKT